MYFQIQLQLSFQGRLEAEIQDENWLAEFSPHYDGKIDSDFATRAFGTAKLKLEMGEALAIALAAAVREAVGPQMKIRANANGGWTIGAAKRQIRKQENTTSSPRAALSLENFSYEPSCRLRSPAPLRLRGS